MAQEYGMTVNDCLHQTLDGAALVVNRYLQDIPHQAWMQRPHPQCNHLNWQVGHLILSEHQMIASCLPGSLPELPLNFARQYSRDETGNDDPTAFLEPARLLELQREQRAATMAVVAGLSAQQLDQATPEAIRGYCPTVAAVFYMIALHWTMHAGQWVILRRQLQLPIVI